MIRNDYYRMKKDDVRTVIGICEKSGVSSIVIEGYEWLLHQGELSNGEYERLMELYGAYGDETNFQRVKERHDAIYKQ